METSTVPLGNPRRIFARPTRRPLARRLPWLVMILCVAGASAALGAIIAAGTAPRPPAPLHVASTPALPK